MNCFFLFISSCNLSDVESNVSDFRRNLIFVRLVFGQVLCLLLLLLLLCYIRRRVFLSSTIVKLPFDGTSFYPLVRIMFSAPLKCKKAKK